MRDRVSLQKMIMTGNLNLNHMDKHHQTLLLMALQDNDIELFGILVNFGADLNLRYQQGKTILMIAIEQASILLRKSLSDPLTSI